MAHGPTAYAAAAPASATTVLPPAMYSRARVRCRVSPLRLHRTTVGIVRAWTGAMSARGARESVITAISTARSGDLPRIATATAGNPVRTRAESPLATPSAVTVAATVLHAARSPFQSTERASCRSTPTQTSDPSTVARTAH